jgi:FdrA protein
MKMGIKTLLEDPSTEVLVLVSKPPHPDVEKGILQLLEGVKKPVIINFLGSDKKESDQPGITLTSTLEEAAFEALKAVGSDISIPKSEHFEVLVEEEIKKLSSSQKYLRGLYSGGTLANETRIILDSSNIFIKSNLAKDPEHKLEDPFNSIGHTIVDMGDDVFTKGAPHPMIDSTKRIARILKEAKDPEVALILLDLVLGYGAHPDPAPELAETINKATEIAKKEGRHIIFVASVCGVPEDPQDSTKQKKDLENAGVIVFPSNASATRFTGEILKRIGVCESVG